MESIFIFIHTVPSLITLFNDLSKEYLPADTQVMHIVDEMLLKIVLSQGGLSPFIYRRVLDHVLSAADAGAVAVQVTCSSISPCAEAARKYVSIPVLKIDEPMVRKAVQLGNHIGVVATAPTTLQPTAVFVNRAAEEMGKRVEVTPVLCQGAYASFLKGDFDVHDRIILDYIRETIRKTDVVILAQASMARVLELLPAAEQTVPVLTSPPLAMQAAANILKEVNANA